MPDVIWLRHVGKLERMTKGAAGFDLQAHLNVKLFLTVGAIKLIPTGVQVEIPAGYEGQVRPRSSLVSKGLLVPNSPGTIDSDYRGEIGVLVYAIRDTIITPGQRIAQLVICPVPEVRLLPTVQLTETRRGKNGFGSTGS